MSEAKNSAPFKNLGLQLRVLRESKRESVAEVSGAVEIDADTLQRIETGVDRPSEDILLLLISHFGLNEERANELFKLAGYTHSLEDVEDSSQADVRQPAVMIMIDPRIMYSDTIEVVADNKGVVLNFGQNSRQGVPLVISRIGMSHTEAKALMGLLHQALYNFENPQNPRQITGGTEAPSET